MEPDLGNYIVDVKATVQPDKRIKLKYVAISGGHGPAIEMDTDLAQQTINVLQKAIAEVKQSNEATQV